MASHQPFGVNQVDNTNLIDDADIIAYHHDDDTFCLTCAQDEFGTSLDNTSAVHSDGLPIRGIAADAPHPPVGLTCARCNEEIVEPVWYDAALYPVELSNTDDDPTQMLAIVRGEFAQQWADHHGALAGGTWECGDGPTFMYDILGWEPGLVDKIKAEGFKLDLSEYSAPDEHDVSVAEHAATCESCGHDWHRAEKHLETPSSDSA